MGWFIIGDSVTAMKQQIIVIVELTDKGYNML